MSRHVAKAFQNALAAWFRDHDIPLRPVVLGIAHLAWKQPQQVMAVANTLARGGEYDIIVNLDGYNDLVLTNKAYFQRGQSPFFPYDWSVKVAQTNTEKLLVGRIYTLRQRERRLAAWGALPWRRSALYGIVIRYIRESAASPILTLNHQRAAGQSGYDLESHGPIWPPQPDDGVAPDPGDLSGIALRVWYRSSVLRADLSRTAGAEYYHFLQPNQCAPDSKPFSDAELAVAYNPEREEVRIYRDAYPLLLRLGDELRQQGINYYDLTQIFAANRETLYADDCCHLNTRGNELLAATMVRHLAPALRNRAALASIKSGRGDNTPGRHGAGCRSAGNFTRPRGQQIVF